MNEIRVKRLLLAGVATFVTWVIVEFLLEGVLGHFLFGDHLDKAWEGAPDLSKWDTSNQALNLLIAVLNSTLLIWLYASLRPMYGVGTKTALITSFFGLILVWSLGINIINLGLIPAQVGLTELAFETVEFPIAMLAGAQVYEGPAARGA